MPKYAATTWAGTNGQSGVCVVCGDDTVCDVYGRDPMEKAKLIADLLNKHEPGFPVNQTDEE